jgi:hypothetical protein
MGFALVPAACGPAEEIVATSNLITHADTYNGNGDRVAYSDFAYDGYGRLIRESRYNGMQTTKTTFAYDDRGRLKTRTDDAGGAHPARLDYEYAAEGKTVKLTQTRDDGTTEVMSNLYENGVLVGRSWGEGRAPLAYTLETAADRIVRRAYLGGGDKLVSTESLTFDEAGKLAAIDYRSPTRTESRRYEYDGGKLVKESVSDSAGKVTAVFKYSYAPCQVFKKYAGVFNYLHVGNLIEEVRGK